MIRFFFEQPNVFMRLSLLRILLSLVCILLIIFGPYNRYYVDTAPIIFDPQFPFYSFPMLGIFFLCIKFGALIAAISFAVGFKTRLSGIYLTVLYAIVNYYVLSFQESFAVETNHLVFYLMAVCVVDTSKYASIDAVHGGSTTPTKAQEQFASFVLSSLLLYVGMLYFQAGLTKLIHSGWIWFTSGDTIYVSTVVEGTEFGKYLTQYQKLFPLMGIATAIFEFSFLPLLLFRNLWPWLCLGALCFHAGTYAVLGISFWFLWLLFPPLFFTHCPPILLPYVAKIKAHAR